MRWRVPKVALGRAAYRVAPWALPVVLGALAFAIFGTVPARLARSVPGELAWGLPELPDRAATVAAAEAVWLERYPWGGGPPPDVAAAPAPAPVPVAIVSTASGHEVVFVLPGAGETRTRAGGSLPDGGRVEQVDALSVVWIDGQGQRQEQRLLADPPRPLSPVP